MISSIDRNANLFPDKSLCLELPSEAWKEPRLFLECPLCHKPLKVNPFIVDNSWKPKKKGSRSDTDSKQSQDEKVQQWLDNGHSLYSLGRYDEAAKCYGKVLEINPQYALAWFNKGVAEDQLGLRGDAAISYRKFVELAPAQHAKYIEIARKRLRELEGR